MKLKISRYMLGIFDLVILVNVLIVGIAMIRQTGIYMDYPAEWLSKTPFDNYVLPGIIGILIYGIGNLMAALFAFANDDLRSWMFSLIMGCVLFLSMIMQIVVLGESYLTTGILFIVSFIQIGLSCISAILYKIDCSK